MKNFSTRPTRCIGRTHRLLKLQDVALGCHIKSVLRPPDKDIGYESRLEGVGRKDAKGEKMIDQDVKLLLKIEAPQDIDVNELEYLSRQLRNEILELDVESVEPIKEESIPEGAMAGDWVKIGELLVELSPVVVPALVSVLKAWIDRRYKGTKETELIVEITLGKFKLKIDRSLSREETVNRVEELRKEVETHPQS